MKFQLIEQLRQMNEEEYRLLQWHMSIAQFCRSVMKKYSVSDAAMAEKLDLATEEFQWFKNGAFRYSLRELAKLEAIQYDFEKALIPQRVEKPIDFPAYEYSQPITPKEEPPTGNEKTS